MAKVKVLLNGYTSGDNPGGEEKTRPTVTLVRDGDLVMVVDPGVLENQDILIKSLKKEKLTIKQVNTVFLTHSHVDHFVNIGMFPNAQIIEYYGIWKNNIAKDRSNQLTNDIEIIETPGHDSTGLSLVVNTDNGKIVICGDIFWKENFPKKDPYADDPKKLKLSRKKVLKIADYVIPGHAGMFKVKK